MKNSIVNRSEELLECWCKTNNFNTIKIPRESCRTPDFKIEIESTIIYAEVKEIESNEEELNSFNLLNERGYGEPHGEEPGKTVRQKIKDSYKQISKFAKKESANAILVLYNNTIVPGLGRLDHYHILTAMFGLQTIPLKPSSDGTIQFGSDYLGEKSSVQPSKNSFLSGILTLYEHPEKGLIGFLYHNPYAKYTLNPNLFKSSTCIQYKPDLYNIKWKKIDV